MSDYDSFESGAESDLGAFEEALEISGYDAVTTTQDGMRQDEFLKESGMVIDTVGEAKKVEEKREKRERNSESGIAAAFEAARHHSDQHIMKIGDLEISRGDLKSAMKEYSKELKDKAKNAKTKEERAEIMQTAARIEQINQRLENGTETDEDIEYLKDLRENDSDFRAITNDTKAANSVMEQPDIMEMIASRNSTYPRDPSKTLSNDFNAQSIEDASLLEDFTSIRAIVVQTNTEEPVTKNEAPQLAARNMDMSDFSFA